MPKKTKHSDVPPEEFSLTHTLHDDRHRLEIVDVPVITVSATFRKDIARYFDEKTAQLDDVVFSRAHFSMAVAALEQARRNHLTAWLVDPTNYVSPSEWKRVQFTEFVGQVAARTPIVKKIKDLVDNFVRSRLPIRKAITPPLIYVSKKIKKPIISFHYEVGNVLVREGKKVIQVVTDPHVRMHYLLEAQRKKIVFAVFDKDTKRELLEKAKLKKKFLNPKRVFVTGPPVDPRIVDARQKKTIHAIKRRPLRLAITTGGLGTNKQEIEKILRSIAPEVKKGKLKLLLYASTHPDFVELFRKVAQAYKIKIGKVENESARVRILYADSIIDANDLLISYAFPWADGFVTKPSGDMAYDAVAAGCFLLSLAPWGDWEKRIEEIFYSRGILQKAIIDDFATQLADLASSGWIEKAIFNALHIEPLFLNGIKEIIRLQQKLAKKWV